MTDWIPQDDWSQVKWGDRVRVTHDGNMLTGEVVDILVVRGTDEPYALELECAPSSESLRISRSGWQLSVPAKPAVELPTEPGWYLVGGNNKSVGGTVHLDANGRWWWVGNDYGVSPEKFTAADLHHHAPLTRLEPVAVTAKKILESLRNKRVWGSGSVPFTDVAFRHDSLARVAKEFGVTDE